MRFKLFIVFVLFVFAVIGGLSLEAEAQNKVVVIPLEAKQQNTNEVLGPYQASATTVSQFSATPMIPDTNSICFITATQWRTFEPAPGVSYLNPMHGCQITRQQGKWILTANTMALEDVTCEARCLKW